jgi:FAD/FMN-containing dehydrogenase
VAALVGLTSVEAAVRLAGELRRTLPDVLALELMTGPSLRLVADVLDAAPPVAPQAAAYLLTEVGGASDPLDALASAVGAGDGVIDAAVATERGERVGLWRWREAHSEAGAHWGVVHKLDVTLPAAELARFCADVVARVAAAYPGARTLLFGHVGDGNVHVNVVGPSADDEAVDDLVLGLVVERGGSISAEHGIGTLKRRWLARDRSPAEVEAMRAVKRALDPDGILNPGALFP